ncbi:MAG: nucleoside triphosphate pyrophosphohydrolase [Chloroflexota bacterium]
MEQDLGTFEAFRNIVARLRAPNGCPWDREQTHSSLKPYLIEEAYEALQALDDENTDKLCEELGDLLLQIGLHCQIAEEKGEFNTAEVLKGINQKLIRRHPHVFGTTEVSNSDEVTSNWEELKRKERNEKGKHSLLDDVPKNIPALAYSQIAQQRAARVGFDWNRVDEVLGKVIEELEELRQAASHQQKVSEFGDLLFALANVARWMDIDLESALKGANERFYTRFAYMEKLTQERGISMNDLSLEELDRLWEEAKTALGDSD